MECGQHFPFAVELAHSCAVLLSTNTLSTNSCKNDSPGLFPSASYEEYPYYESVPWGGFLGIEEICDKVNMTLPVYTISW